MGSSFAISGVSGISSDTPTDSSTQRYVHTLLQGLMTSSAEGSPGDQDAVSSQHQPAQQQQQQRTHLEVLQGGALQDKQRQELFGPLLDAAMPRNAGVKPGTSGLFHVTKTKRNTWPVGGAVHWSPLWLWQH